jgi:hypothetical protein
MYKALVLHNSVLRAGGALQACSGQLYFMGAAKGPSLVFKPSSSLAQSCLNTSTQANRPRLYSTLLWVFACASLMSPCCCIFPAGLQPSTTMAVLCWSRRVTASPLPSMTHLTRWYSACRYFLYRWQGISIMCISRCAYVCMTKTCPKCSSGTVVCSPTGFYSLTTHNHMSNTLFTHTRPFHTPSFACPPPPPPAQAQQALVAVQWPPGLDQVQEQEVSNHPDESVASRKGSSKCLCSAGNRVNGLDMLPRMCTACVLRPGHYNE